jgi:hypothetical protein
MIDGWKKASSATASDLACLEETENKQILFIFCKKTSRTWIEAISNYKYMITSDLYFRLLQPVSPPVVLVVESKSIFAKSKI